MRAVFNIREETVEASISPATIRDFDAMCPIMAADLAKDILHDATVLYKRQVKRLREPWAGGSDNAST